ncbi:MAG: ATP-binding protein [Syntrophobacterales bacterium]|nr:ATP-binding protein [Syntrophobacterales bacterium]
MLREGMRISIAKKFTLFLLILSLMPPIVLGMMHLANLHELEKIAVEKSSIQLEQKSRESLEVRAVELANRVSEFLQSIEVDAHTLCMMPKRLDVLQKFYSIHKKTIWTRDGTNDHPIEIRKELPLYREIAFIDLSGKELIKIVDGEPVPQNLLRDVSKPENTTYKSETYFNEVMKLPKGKIYVSHVTGWFVSLEEQLQGAPELEMAVEGKKYEGIVRFAIRCEGGADSPEGVIVLSLDHRHLMEFTMHILPTEERFVVFPSYKSGNYAFMFDDEGWIISHPKFCDIRGLRPDGSPFDPTAPYYTRENLLLGKVPFNLDYAGIINPNYPFIASEVRKGRSGVTNTFNVGGIPRVMAYAPIFYYQKPYDRYGIFGGITIGVDTTTFKAPISRTEKAITSIIRRTKIQNFLVMGITILASILFAFLLARAITKPILHLSRKAMEIAEGKVPEDIELKTGNEIETLSTSLAKMAKEIHQYRNHLENSLKELASSKKSLEQYSYELEKQVWIIKNIHYLSQLLSTIYERDRVLEEVLKTSVKGLGYDRAILYLFDPSSRQLVCHGTFGFSEEHERRAKSLSFHIDREDCSITRAFRHGKTIFLEEVTELDTRIVKEWESKGFVWTPLRTGNQVIGVIGAERLERYSSFSKIEVEALEILANDTARAIERSELYRGLIGEKNFISSILLHVPIGIIVLGEDGKIKWFNPYAEKLFGIQDAEGKQYSQVFINFPSWKKIIEEAIHSIHLARSVVEHNLIFPDGKERIIEYSYSSIDKTEGDEKLFLISCRDITKRKQMEEHMRRTDRLASLGVLAAGIAHEMRNPLTGISLMLDDLHDHLHDNREERELIQRALEEIERLENLINSLLDFATPSRELRLEPTSLSSIIADTLLFMRKLAKNHHVRITTEIDDNIPPIQADREKMKQVFLNLFINAIQAMPNGGILTIGVSKAPESIRVTISDTGEGISPEDIPYIFDPFFSRRPRGSGLGLAIVHSIVVEHGGRVAVSSNLGKGTTFVIDFPTQQSKIAKEGDSL